MLSELWLKYFKCFETLRLPLNPLTLLSGTNASGKSSVLHGLVLLHQTMHEHEWSNRLILNGSSIELGTVSDVVDKVFGRHNFEIGVVDGDLTCQWNFVGDRTDMSVSVESIALDGRTHSQPEKLRYLLPPELNERTESLTECLQGLTYITAERVGPREVYPIRDRQVSTVVGPLGEDAMSLLHWKKDEPVPDNLALPEVPNTLFRQVEERMRMFFPGCALAIQPVPQANAVTLGLRNSDDTDFHRPIHGGFGLTQLLPIVIAALSGKKGGVLIIENPEVHLHPAGQADVGQFLAEVASAGVQVIIETHSDHILNGIRRSVKAGRLIADHVAIHFFRPRIIGKAQVISPLLDISGNLDSWPDGFFDQFEKDMNHFAGWGE